MLRFAMPTILCGRTWRAGRIRADYFRLTKAEAETDLGGEYQELIDAYDRPAARSSASSCAWDRAGTYCREAVANEALSAATPPSRSLAVSTCRSWKPMPRLS